MQRSFLIPLISLVALGACSTNEKKFGDDKLLSFAAGCNKAAVSEFLDVEARGVDMKNYRQYVHTCGELDFLPKTAATAKPINPEEVTHNVLGDELERTNVWFFTEEEKGSQEVGMNVFNYSSDKISWVHVGYSPGYCSEQDEWEATMKIDLESPLPARRHTIIEWTNPADVNFAGEGCMIVLAAG